MAQTESTVAGQDVVDYRTVSALLDRPHERRVPSMDA